MRYLVDSDWVIDWLSGRPSALQLLNELVIDGLAISVITYGEVYEGIYYGRDPAQTERIFRSFLRGVSVLPVNRAIARAYARLRGSLRVQGQLIPQPDILIAATAIHHGLTLVTRNQSDFGRISGLSIRE